MSLSIFVQNILTLIQETFAFVSWRTLQIRKYNVVFDQWRNPEASIAYETSPHVLVEITFAMSALPPPRCF